MGKDKTINGKELSPESLMMSYAYDPMLSEGSIKPPIFQTSTFVFNNAEEGKHFFEIAYGLKEKRPDETMGLIYSRLNNPDMEILEDRLCLWDKAEQAAVFDSGMAAISSTLMAFLRPGDTILHSEPIYGGTYYFVKNILPAFGVNVISFRPQHTREEVEDIIQKAGAESSMKMIYIETPTNPTNDLLDIKMCAELSKKYSTDEKQCLTVVDNTFLGPVFQHPIKHGADVVLYSATKFIGGHSDLIAGVALGSNELVTAIKGMRTFLGSGSAPLNCWLMMRSLETLKLRMDKMAENASEISNWLEKHPKVEEVHYLGNLKEGTNQHRIFEEQCESPGSMVSFDIKGGEKEAFIFLNSLKLIKLAVSLGGTESLAEHPATMTHSDISIEEQNLMGISEKMVRLSIGVENYNDILLDIEQALDQI